MLYRLASGAVSAGGGIVDKFAGDAVMATFNVSGTAPATPSTRSRPRFHCGITRRRLSYRSGSGFRSARGGGQGASDDNIAVTGEATNLAARLQARRRVLGRSC